MTAISVLLEDVRVLTRLVQRALPRLDFFDYPDQEMAGNELLRLLNRAGAIYEHAKEKEQCVNFGLVAASMRQLRTYKAHISQSMSP